MHMGTLSEAASMPGEMSRGACQLNLLLADAHAGATWQARGMRNVPHTGMRGNAAYPRPQLPTSTNGPLHAGTGPCGATWRPGSCLQPLVSCWSLNP